MVRTINDGQPSLPGLPRSSTRNQTSTGSRSIACGLAYTFKHDKATRDFGYQARYSAEEAFMITLDWLKTQKF